MKLKSTKSFFTETSVYTPIDNADAYDNQEVSYTGGGREPNYPVSNSSYSYVLSSGWTDAFISGFFEVSSLIELERLFKGTNRSAETAYDLNTEKLVKKAEQDATQQEETDYFTNVWSPGISAAIAAANAAIAAEDPFAYFSALADIEDLDTGLEARQSLTNIASAAYITAINNHGSYIRNGRINNPDPYQLDDPTTAAALEKKRKEEQQRNEQIDKELEKLKQDNERLKTESGFRAFMSLLNLGFDIATTIAILNFLTGPADEAALIAGKLTVQEILEKMAQKGATQAAAKKVAPQAAKNVGTNAAKARNFQRQNPGKYNPFVSDKTNQLARQQGVGTNVTGQKSSYRNPTQFKNSYEPEGIVIAESRKRILREIKKPYKLPEVPKQKYKMNFSGKYSAQNTPDKTTSKLSDDLVASGNARGQRWRMDDKYWQGYETTERMNIIYDRVGHGDQYWEEIIKENKRKNNWKTREMQEHLNIMDHEKAMKEDNPNYESPFYKEFIQEQETIEADKDPLFKKIAKKLKKEIDYPDKPSKNGVPNEPPPEMVNGYHPEFGKRKSYYNKLDPQSASAMPETGDDEIDAQVKAARKKPK